MTKTRIFNGLKQYNVNGLWKFHVTGFDATFSGSAGNCSVESKSGADVTVSIDASDRILINGNWYSPTSWTH